MFRSVFLKIILLFVLMPFVSSGQNCDCPLEKEVYRPFYLTLFNDKIDSSLYHLSRLKHEPELKCKILYNLWRTEIFYRQKNNDSALICIEKTNALVGDYNCDNDILLRCQYYRGIIYEAAGKHEKAIEYYLIALKTAEKQKSKEYISGILSEISVIFRELKQLDKALFYIQKAFATVDDSWIYSGLFYEMASIYFDMYELKKKNDFLSKALESAKESLKYAKSVHNGEIVFNSYNLLAKISNSSKDYNTSSLYCDSIFNSADKLLYKNNLSSAYYLQSLNYAGIGKLDYSKKFADSSYKYAFDSKLKLQALMRIYVVAKEQKNYASALFAFEKSKFLNDSISSIKKTEIVNQLEQKYNKSQNEIKIRELNRQSEITALNVKFLAVGILASVLIILVIIFFYRQSILKSKFEMLETEQRLNRARMNPHFFFNALTSIQTLSMDAENQSKVSSLISKFSKIMRQSLESTYDELATIEDEILFLSNYLDLQKTRFNNKFEYEISVNENLAQDELKIPSMLLQPFLENSIEHGFKNIDYKGKLDIIFKKEENEISVELKDNGKGFNTTEKHKEYPSRATQIIADRLLILNKQHKSNSHYEIKANSDGKGICVKVNLPFIY